MKQLLIVSALLAAGSSLAQTSSNAEDYAQPRPDSTVKADVVTETQVTQALMVDGKVISETTQTAVQPSAEAMKIEAPAKSLPAPAIIDDKDLEATMKAMGRNFKAINNADTLAAMAEPAAELSKWASQAEALGIEGNAQDQQKYAQGMQRTRNLLADLEIAIENNDEITVRTIINELGDTRKEYHKYFDVN